MLTACAPLNRVVDRWSLARLAELASSGEPGLRQAPLPYQSAEDLERLTRPDLMPQVAIEPEVGHRLDDVRLKQEQLSFDSAIHLRHAESDRAVFHLWRRGPLGRRPLLLWIPGLHVAERDWPSLSEYFTRVLEAGADVIMIEPPYHLSRTPRGFGSGEAVLATDYVDHLSVFAQEISDVRRLVTWLRSRGVRRLGAFGSSMGGGVAMRVATFDRVFDFLVLKQPLVDWNVVVSQPELAPVRQHIEAQGVTPKAMQAAYSALDSRGEEPKLAAAHIFLLYGRFDQIAPEPEALSLARAWGVSNVIAYPRGHSLIMFGGRPYRDVQRIIADEVGAGRRELDYAFSAFP
jgi:pimeloyl-ACP methyl ester carboxylesterase